MSVFTRTDVTAVKLYKNFILAGIGSYIHIFDKYSTKLLQRVLCLDNQKIYGFVPHTDERNVIVFGGKQYTVLCVESPEICSYQVRFKPVICNDWLHSAVWYNDYELALLTAHNVVQKWDINKQIIVSTFYSKDNSIVYSGLLVPLNNDLLVLAGTVFSNIIINIYGEEKSQHLIGHKGVIFSISCNLEKQIIVTTSDDRSVRIWGPNTASGLLSDTKEYWQSVHIICKHEIYGHLARVMRNCITTNYIVSVGEDAAICFWDHNGKLLKKILSHQNGCIWSVDADDENLVTGGGDSGVILHPLSVASENGSHKFLNIAGSAPKKIVFTARRNIVILNESDELLYYDEHMRKKSAVKLTHNSTYKLFSISSCKQIIAVGDMAGNLDVFVENCKNIANLQNIISVKLNINKILSMQFAGNRHIVLCSENGIITVLASKRTEMLEIYSKFTLPLCKERWLTAAAFDFNNGVLVVGDRCGNMHVYVNNIKDPIKTFGKVHGRYGPTSITLRNNEIITTGRDGKINYFIVNDEDKSLVKYMHSTNLEFQWVEKFLDRKENFICGFQERIFVVFDLKSNSKLLEVPCGGGHRCWDAIRYVDKLDDNYEEFIEVMYVKNSEIHLNTFKLSNIASRNVIKGSHSKEINCLKIYTSSLDESTTFYITGGEDTTLRISSLNTVFDFKDEVVFKHLSNVRALKIYTLDNNRLLLISAGGRAQLCIKMIEFKLVDGKVSISASEIIDYMLKGTDRERKGNQNWRNCAIDFDPETRIMDLDIIRHNNECIIHAGCSDAVLRIFNFNYINNTLENMEEHKHHRTCILKVRCFKFCNKDIVASCTTRGEIAFFDASENHNLIFEIKTNKSGINCIDTKVISDNELLIATGGDDNAIHLNLLSVYYQSSLTAAISQAWSTDKAHSSQIVGIYLLEDVLLTTSIDQRITLFKYAANVKSLHCIFLSQAFTDIADVQGMEILHCTSDIITVCVYGKGMEVIRLDRPR